MLREWEEGLDGRERGRERQGGRKRGERDNERGRGRKGGRERQILTLVETSVKSFFR